MQAPDKPSLSMANNEAMETKEPSFQFSQEKMRPSQEQGSYQPPLPLYSPPPEMPGPSNAPMGVPQQQHQVNVGQNNFGLPQARNNVQYMIYEERNIFNAPMQSSAQAAVPSISVRRVTSVTRNFQRPIAAAPKRPIQQNYEQTCKLAAKPPAPRLAGNNCKKCKINLLRLKLYESRYAVMLRLLDQIKMKQDICISKTEKSYKIFIGLMDLAKLNHNGDILGYNWLKEFCEKEMAGYINKTSPYYSNDNNEGGNGVEMN